MASEEGAIRSRKQAGQAQKVERSAETLPVHDATKVKKTIGRTPDGTGICPMPMLLRTTQTS